MVIKLFSAKSYNSPQLLNTIKQRYLITEPFYYINTIYHLYIKYITNIYVIYYRYSMNTTTQLIGDGFTSKQLTEYRDGLATRAFEADVPGWKTVELMCEAIRSDKKVRELEAEN